MATATPMQLDWVEVFDLLRLTGRVGPFQLDPSLTRAYYNCLSALVREQNITREEWELLRRSMLSLERHDPFLWQYLQDAVIYGIVSPATSLGFLLSFLRLRFASSLFAIRETLGRRREKVTATLIHHQNYRESAENRDDDRDFMTEEDYEPDERILESLLKNRNPDDLTWERDRLGAMLMTLDDLSGTPSKMKELLSVLNQRRIKGGRMRQTVIFTRFYDTLTDILERLRGIDSSLLIGTYSGRGGQFVDPRTQRIRGVERDDIKHRFLREEIDILICTDAAAEGLNLQTADLLINYDLPWNPMKVEQRIGRIDRIGQKHDRILY